MGSRGLCRFDSGEKAAMRFEQARYALVSCQLLHDGQVKVSKNQAEYFQQIVKASDRIFAFEDP